MPSFEILEHVQVSVAPGSRSPLSRDQLLLRDMTKEAKDRNQFERWQRYSVGQPMMDVRSVGVPSRRAGRAPYLVVFPLSPNIHGKTFGDSERGDRPPSAKRDNVR